MEGPEEAEFGPSQGGERVVHVMSRRQLPELSDQCVVER